MRTHRYSSLILALSLVLVNSCSRFFDGWCYHCGGQNCTHLIPSVCLPEEHYCIKTVNSNYAGFTKGCTKQCVQGSNQTASEAVYCCHEYLCNNTSDVNQMTVIISSVLIILLFCQY